MATQLSTGGAIMRTVFAALALILVAPIAIHAQTGYIGIFSNNTGTNCNITDAAPGLLSVYVVHVNSTGATACQYKAAKPACMTATYLSDTNLFGVTIGNSQTGVSIGYGGCRNGNIHLQTISYFASGTTPACCSYPATCDPLGYNACSGGLIDFVDCDFNPTLGTGAAGVINGNATCPCGALPGPGFPHDPSPPDGATGLPLGVQLSWQCEHSLGLPLTYDVYLGTSPSPPRVATSHPTNTYSPNFLNYNTTYFWKITAKDSEGRTATGPVWDFTTSNTPASRLAVSSASNYCGLVDPAPLDTIVIDVLIYNSLSPIDAGGFDLTYDPSVLTFMYCVPGDLTEGWDYFRGSDRGNYVRIGGFDLVPIPQWTSGTFARVYFVHDICGIEASGAVNLCPQNLTDDLLTLGPECGEYRFEKYYANGDVNDDGNVTPGDALCAFKGYLSFPLPPEGDCGLPGWDVRSDVNCSRDLTPADALCIFENWLEESCPFCNEWTPWGRKTSLPETQAVVSFTVVREKEDVVVVPVRVSRVPAIKAFGFELTYPADQMEYVDFVPLSAARDMDQIDMKVIEPGRIRVGGYTTRAVSASAPTDILELRFRASVEELSGNMTIGAFVDHLYGAEPVTRVLGSREGEDAGGDVQLFQNHPNPFNPVTAITYEIPASMGEIPVTLVVYNVEGRRVRTLVNAEQPGGVYRVEWDGRNDTGDPASSGVYFYVLKAGPQVVKKKMLLLK
jgi:hypothetical protein